MAVLLHALYNFLVVSQGILGFWVAVAMVVLLSSYMRRRIRTLDALPHTAAPAK
jgi:hypothetical protein